MGDSDINLGDTCEKGSQLRPNIVWFGEMVPMIPVAADICSTADIFVVVGTSLQVYPAAGLLEYAPHGIPRYFIDPRPALPYGSEKWTLIAEKATVGTQKLLSLLHE